MKTIEIFQELANVTQGHKVRKHFWKNGSSVHHFHKFAYPP